MAYYETIVLDFETDHHGGPDGDSPEAHWKDNEVVLCGWMYKNKYYQSEDTKELAELIDNIITVQREPVLLVGHNLKFDLKYLMRDNPKYNWRHPYLSAFCTMTAWYIRSGHKDKFVTLEALAKKVGSIDPRLTKKTFALAPYIKAGGKVRNLDRKELGQYLEQDVRITHQIFENFPGNIRANQTRHILPLAEMELNGLHFDVKKARQIQWKCTSQMMHLEDTIKDIICMHFQWQDGTSINRVGDFSSSIGTKSKVIKPFSNRTISALLTGVPKELKVTNKWRLVRAVPIQTVPNIFKGVTPNPTLGYPVGEEVLKELANDGHQIPQLVLKYRKLAKLTGTYLGPFLEACKYSGYDTIHPKLNTTSTNTGRLSSTKPNGQNIPPEVRNLIKPRLSNNYIIEIDFDQLEMVTVAYLSEDPSLINDLSKGVDLHYETGKSVMGWSDPSDMTKKERTLVKNVNFGVLYGGTAVGLARSTGQDKALIERLIASFFSKYPQVAKWQKAVYTEVVNNMMPLDALPEQRYSGTWRHVKTGRKFYFEEQNSPLWLQRRTGRAYSFSPQQTKNYPVQGIAGGEIVMRTLVAMYKSRLCRLTHDTKFIMTVHDSIILEATEEVRSALEVEVLPEILCDIERDMKFPEGLHLQVSIERGKTWS